MGRGMRDGWMGIETSHHLVQPEQPEAIRLHTHTHTLPVNSTFIYIKKNYAENRNSKQ